MSEPKWVFVLCILGAFDPCFYMSQNHLSTRMSPAVSFQKMNFILTFSKRGVML